MNELQGEPPSLRLKLSGTNLALTFFPLCICSLATISYSRCLSHSDTGGENIPVLYNIRNSTVDIAGLHAFIQGSQQAGTNKCSFESPSQYLSGIWFAVSFRQEKPCLANADLLGAVSQRVDAEILHESQAGTTVSASACA